MENNQETIAEMAKVLEEKGYGFFNFRHGRIGIDFKSGLADFIQRAGQGKYTNMFPVFACTTIHATTPDNPVTIACFSISEGTKKELVINNIQLSMYENIEAPLRTSIEIKPGSLSEIPDKRLANEMINNQWNEQKLKNLNKRRQIIGNKHANKKCVKIGKLW